MSFETRIDRLFKNLKDQGRGALGVYVTAGDPDFDTAQKILNGLPEAGADMIEFGMPFSDPMADGPAIQAASLRALANGQTLKKTIKMVRNFRTRDDVTPIVLMGYFNPIYAYGVDLFLEHACEAGVDGLIVVDLPPEEENDLCLPALKAGISFIFLTAPTTTDARLPRVLENASGFIYYVSIKGITGTASSTAAQIKPNIDRIKAKTSLPVAVGFGIKTAANVAEFTSIAEAAIVGTAVVNIIADHLDDDNRAQAGLVEAVHKFVGELASGLRETSK